MCFGAEFSVAEVADARKFLADRKTTGSVRHAAVRLSGSKASTANILGSRSVPQARERAEVRCAAAVTVRDPVQQIVALSCPKIRGL